MTGNTIRRTVATAAVLATVGGVTGLAATAANASTGERLCKDSDVQVTATKSASASGHHAVALHYAPADAGTHCTLSGAPYGATFYNAANKPLGVQSSIAKGGQPRAVTIDAKHAATSYVLIPNKPQPGPASVTGLRFHLPSDASNTPVGVAWPTGSELNGAPQFTNITQS